MPLPIIFGPLTSIVTTYFDENFAAVGELVIAPCAIAGTNSLVLTPFANNPTVSLYGNYMVFSGVASGTNTTAVTAQLLGLGTLPVYTDTAGGPVALTGGEIVIGNLVMLVYDANLGGGGGGFHLLSSSQVQHFTSLAVSGLLTAGTVSVSGAVTAATVSATSLVVGGGAAVKHVLSAAASLTFTSIVPGASQAQTITVTGAAVGDGVFLGMPASITDGVAYDGRVSATNLVVVRATNATSGTVTPAAGTFRAVVMGF